MDTPETVAPEVRALKAEIDDSNANLGAVLKRAGVAHTTWGRWASGKFDPRSRTLRKIREALEAELADRAA